MKGIFALMIFIVAVVDGCGDAAVAERRIVLYSTSPGFQPVSQYSSAEPPSPAESPEIVPPEIALDDPPADDAPEDPPAEGDPLPKDEPPPDEGPSEAPLPAGADPFADRVVSYRIGEGGGFHEEMLPDIVLGAPRGIGPYQGSLHVFSLGIGGEIVLEFTDYIVFDGEGVDLTVFENAFQVGSDPQNTFAEPGIVGVSNDGVNFIEFPCDPVNRPFSGCAGVKPVLANADLSDIDPTDPAVSGGDSFDLRDVGLQTARFIRIRDSGLGLGPIGPGTAGFDLDAVAIIHGTLP